MLLLDTYSTSIVLFAHDGRSRCDAARECPERHCNSVSISRSEPATLRHAHCFAVVLFAHSLFSGRVHDEPTGSGTASSVKHDHRRDGSTNCCIKGPISVAGVRGGQESIGLRLCFAPPRASCISMVRGSLRLCAPVGVALRRGARALCFVV